jgi:SAM-dependent methyltransferase
MLEQARKSSCGKQVQWVQGDGLALEQYEADLVIMTSHVAQFHLEDEYWVEVLKKINDSLKPGGYVLFDTRNPDVKAWEGWYSPGFHETFSDPKKRRDTSLAGRASSRRQKRDYHYALPLQRNRRRTDHYQHACVSTQERS